VNFADLEIDLHRRGADAYAVELRFTPPDRQGGEEAELVGYRFTKSFKAGQESCSGCLTFLLNGTILMFWAVSIGDQGSNSRRRHGVR
jgi:hypothetical protein